MKKLTLTISIPWWVVHLVWTGAVAAIVAIAVFALLKSGVDINLSVEGRA